MDLQNFDPSEYELDSFDLVPPGEYVAAIVNDEDVPNKSGSGSHLKLTLQIIEGPHKGRLLWDRLNLQHPKEIVVKIARGKLSSICKAVGVLRPKDTAELRDKPLIIRVGVSGDFNEVKGYKPLNTSKQRPARTSPPSARTSMDDEAPW